MSTEQEQWAAQIREIPTVFRRALLLVMTMLSDIAPQQANGQR
jgi:hypothetical protein